MNLKTANKAELQAFLAEARTELEKLATRGADLTGADTERFDELEAQHKEARARISAIDARAAKVFDSLDTLATEDGAPTTTKRTASTTTSLRGKTTLAKGESFRGWAEDNDRADRAAEGLSFDKLIRGMAVGDWTDATEERALTTTSSSAGGVLVPTPLATNLIDLARSQAVVLQAGATVVPMTSKTLRVPRLTGEGAPQFYNEGQQRVAQDMTFDAVTLEAKTFDRLILISKELFEDSNPAAGNVISEAFAKQFAVGIDKFALFGDGNAPNPLGLVNTPDVPKVAHGANGTALTSYDWLIQAVGNVAAQNFTPTGQITSPRTATALQLLKNTQGDYLTGPANLPPAFVTSGVPVNLETGTSTDTSVIVTGDFTQLYIGLRSDFSLKVLPERWADTGQIGFLASSRWDIAVAQPKAFQVDQGIR